MITAEQLKNILKGRVVIVGIGNVLRADDGLGSLLVRRLSDKVEAICIDAGNALENHMGPIARYNPDTVLLVDAVHLDLEPGQARLVDPSRIEHSGLSTHDVSPGMFLDFLAQESNCSVFLLGVQPECIEIGSRISATVRDTLELLERLLLDALGFAEEITLNEESGSWKQHGTFSPL